MKRLILVLAITALLATPAWAYERRWTVEPSMSDYDKKPFEAGSTINPYEIRQNNRGDLEISTPFSNPDKPMEPGTPLNPIIIRPRR